jgi:hypothetical protein
MRVQRTASTADGLLCRCLALEQRLNTMLRIVSNYKRITTKVVTTNKSNVYIPYLDAHGAQHAAPLRQM